MNWVTHAKREMVVVRNLSFPKTYPLLDYSFLYDYSSKPSIPSL